MLRVFMLLVSCLANYETVRDLAQGAFTAGQVSMGVLCCIGTAIATRRARLFRG